MRVDVEELLQEIVNVLVVIVEAGGAAVIIIGAVWAFLRFLWAGLTHRNAGSFVPVRLTLGRFLALGLEFQLAADILKTAVAPSWEEIGQLAAIAAIRTALNYFLGKEIAEERRQVDEEKERSSDGAAESSSGSTSGDSSAESTGGTTSSTRTGRTG
ncbi:DUF1622 domain-containing protein [Blastococcus capsensis]|uniref:DUF1622 domain-containing protein n=1 Tax=Blastococcus capsensis TaxID=1564163 RepID=UPI0025407183|nr:DUF1622 domain-containing protein [Blastococcus capsensis]MDK3256865.1 DUF1622 domain-containing protein [Blastococcus capsensis]